MFGTSLQRETLCLKTYLLKCSSYSCQQNQAEATNDRFVTFGQERYAPIPGETGDGARAMQIQASFAWREIPRDRLTLGKILGEGEFGMVVKGELTEDDGHVTPCAVKKLKRMFIDLMLRPVTCRLVVSCVNDVLSTYHIVFP